MNKYRDFFDSVFPEALDRLEPETSPLWGSMNPEEMLQHLRLAVKMSRENQGGEITTPDEKLPAFMRFLMSDRPLVKHAKRPAYFEQAVKSQPLESLKTQLKEELEQVLQYFDDHPNHTSNHQDFGELNSEEWRQLHYKHFTHHLTQFGLIEE